jgi:hypothetical protein
MKHPEGLALAKRLIALSDVVAENFSARVMASWGLDYSRMKEVREDIIMASLQAFGQTGPRRDFVSFGPILMAFSGMTYLWRDPEVERPARLPDAFADYGAFLWCPRHTSCVALPGAHGQRPIHRHLPGGNRSFHARSRLLGIFINGRPGSRETQPLAAPHGCYRAGVTIAGV